MKTIKQHRSELGRITGFFTLGLLMGLILLVATARLTWHTKFYPGVEVAGIPVSGLNRDQAKNKLLNSINNYHVEFIFNGSSWVAPTGVVEYEIESTLNDAYHYGRRFAISDYLLLLINKKTNYPLRLSEGKTEKMEQLINEMSGVIEIPPIDPVVSVVGGKINIENGIDGILINQTLLDKKIKESYELLSVEPINVPTNSVNPKLSSDNLSELRVRAEALVDKSIILKFDDESIKITPKELIAFLSTSSEIDIWNKIEIEEYVAGLSKSIDKEPQDAKFDFADGKVNEFAPGKDGVQVDEQLTSVSIQQGIQKLLESESKSENVQIEVNRTTPNITTEKVNELGIKERIGRGESFYQHSIPNRIYNVSLASTRLNSALIAPGEEVSFNSLVGEVSAATGYRQAYIISGGRTVLGDGGGLCQVSTTMFRAAMSAGLPILERWGHAYRVSYYELNSKPGVDATVIAPSKDFRFLNDTPGHILIQTINDPKSLHLIIEIYGTSDSRVATISEPKVWGVSPPLPTVYQDDPTLPVGTMKQVDWAAGGAKASFEYKVVRNGETIQEQTFSTVYRPWASVFLKGTAI